MTSLYFLHRIFFSSARTTITFLLFLTTCSQLTLVTSDEINSRIVGGGDADPGEYQFFTAWGSSCGATIIHDDILLTAAHCNPLIVESVVAGAYTKGLSGEPDSINSVSRIIKERIIHPDYNVESWNYDIMLLKLDEPVPSSLPKVTLNSNSSKPEVLSTVIPLGLGRLAEVDGAFPEVLQEVNVRVIDPTICNRSPMYPGWIQDSMICAGVSGGGQDACFGDSGGPLLQKDSDGNIIQVGIVSYGTGCARADKPGVYHRVSSSYDWIQDQICEFSSVKPESCPGVREAVINEAFIDEAINEGTVSQEVRLYTYPEDYLGNKFGNCEGDCDRDSDCAEGLFCFFKQEGNGVNIPGCAGSDDTSADFCVENQYRSAEPAVPLRQSIYTTKTNRLRGSTYFRDSAMGGTP